MPEMASSQALDTFPRLLIQHAQMRGEQTGDAREGSGDLAVLDLERCRRGGLRAGLRSCEMGFRRGENLAIVGENRPRMYMMMTAVQCLGGVPLPLYQDAVASEMLFVLLDAEIRFVFVEDQEQVDKLLEIQDQLPQLEHVFTTIRAACATIRSRSSTTSAS
jgi:long-chain acyl-CoA synthetase